MRGFFGLLLTVGGFIGLVVMIFIAFSLKNDQAAKKGRIAAALAFTALVLVCGILLLVPS